LHRYLKLELVLSLQVRQALPVLLQLLEQPGELQALVLLLQLRQVPLQVQLHHH
jgi:hypothetical protein